MSIPSIVTLVPPATLSLRDHVFRYGTFFSNSQIHKDMAVSKSLDSLEAAANIFLENIKYVREIFRIYNMSNLYIDQDCFDIIGPNYILSHLHEKRIIDLVQCSDCCKIICECSETSIQLDTYELCDRECNCRQNVTQSCNCNIDDDEMCNICAYCDCGEDDCDECEHNNEEKT